MSARDVIDAVKYWDFDNMGMSSETTIGGTFGADAILSALEAAGYAVVPKEPTEAMKRAGGGDATDKQFLAYAFWTAMLTAAKETK